MRLSQSGDMRQTETNRERDRQIDRQIGRQRESCDGGSGYLLKVCILHMEDTHS